MSAQIYSSAFSAERLPSSFQVRQVPHGVPAPDRGRGLRAYSRARNAFPEAKAPASLLNSLGRPLDSRYTPKFAELAKTAGIQARRGSALRDCMTCAMPSPSRRPGLVSRRRERPGHAPGTVHLARAYRPEAHVLVPLGRPGAPRPGRRPARGRRPGSARGIMTNLAPSCWASSPTGWPGRRRPARTRSPPTATPAGS
jgi:hypothetical protein